MHKKYKKGTMLHRNVVDTGYEDKQKEIERHMNDIVYKYTQKEQI